MCRSLSRVVRVHLAPKRLQCRKIFMNVGVTLIVQCSQTQRLGALSAMARCAILWGIS